MEGLLPAGAVALGQDVARFACVWSPVCTRCNGHHANATVVGCDYLRFGKFVSGIGDYIGVGVWS